MMCDLCVLWTQILTLWRPGLTYENALKEPRCIDRSIPSEMFYLIGLGLCDEKDITLRGLEVVKRSARVYLEAYTSILMVQKERLHSMGKI